MAAQSEEKESKENDNDTNNENIKLIKGPMTIECPFWSKIANSKRILLSGAGGGFDIYQFGHLWRERENFLNFLDFEF